MGALAVAAMTRLVSAKRARCVIGLANTGAWAVEKGGQVFEAGGQQSFMPFVACLEEPIEELRLLIRSALVVANLNPDLEVTFPYADIAAEGIGSRSRHWVSLGIDWAEHVELNDRLKRALLAMQERKDGSQKERQRARKLTSRTA